MHALIPFLDSFRPRTFYQDVVEGIESALADFGHTSERFAFKEIGLLSPQEMERVFTWARNSRCDIVVDVCCWGFALSHVCYWYSESGPNPTVFDSFGAHYVGLMFDQPYFQPGPFIASNSLYLGHTDKKHPEVLNALFPECRPRKHLFMPPATRASNDRAPARWRDRRLPILYVGNLEPYPLNPVFGDSPVDRITRHALEILDSTPEMALSEAIEKANHVNGEELINDQTVGVYRSLEYLLRHRLRYRVISSLAAYGLPLEVYGNGWEQVELGPTVRIHPPIDYNTYLDLIGNSKLCIDVSTYLNGANDRAVQFAINGSAFISNAPGYLRESFGDAASYYSPAHIREAADTLELLLAHPEELELRSERLREAAKTQHLWHHRLALLFDALVPHDTAALSFPSQEHVPNSS